MPQDMDYLSGALERPGCDRTGGLFLGWHMHARGSRSLVVPATPEWPAQGNGPSVDKESPVYEQILSVDA
jgi:hypothetical protein